MESLSHSFKTQPQTWYSEKHIPNTSLTHVLLLKGLVSFVILSCQVGDKIFTANLVVDDYSLGLSSSPRYEPPAPGRRSWLVHSAVGTGPATRVPFPHYIWSVKWTTIHTSDWAQQERSRVGKSTDTDSGVKILGCSSWLGCVLAALTWAHPVTSLCLNLLICKVGMIAVPAQRVLVSLT